MPILKVILESGTLSDPELIHKAATIAMEAGADFIKTSTGKNGIARDARGCRGHVPRDPPVRRKNRP